MNTLEPKKKPKGPIHYEIELNAEQRAAKETIDANKITVLTGKAGSGKTLVAVQAALDMLFRKEVNRIVLSRPAVTAGEEVGIMPGDEKQKLAPYVAPLVETLYDLYNRDKIDQLMREDIIRVIPVGLMRGRNLNGVTVIDEAQNVTDKQMKLILTRICKGAKLILCGDVDQIDLKRDHESGFGFVCNDLRLVKNLEVVNLNTNHRDEIVDEILNAYAAKNR